MRIHKLLILCAILPLAGCGGTTARQVLGMERRAPDAFSVSTHAPLEVPRDLSALPTPQPGMPRPQEASAQQQARAAVFLGNEPTEAPATASACEVALLSRAGQAEGNIRTQVNKDAARDAASQKGPLDWMIFWRPKYQPGVVVDATAEAARLKTAREQGQTATATPTPAVEETGRLGAAGEVQ